MRGYAGEREGFSGNVQAIIQFLNIIMNLECLVLDQALFFCKLPHFTNFTLILQNHTNGFYFAGICYSHSQKTKNKS